MERPPRLNSPLSGQTSYRWVTTIAMTIGKPKREFCCVAALGKIQHCYNSLSVPPQLCNTFSNNASPIRKFSDLKLSLFCQKMGISVTCAEGQYFLKIWSFEELLFRTYRSEQDEECWSEWVSEYQHIIGHFVDESFQSITCTVTDNITRTTKRQNTQTNKITQRKKGP